MFRCNKCGREFEKDEDTEHGTVGMNNRRKKCNGKVDELDGE